MLCLGGADAERERAERTVGGGVAVAAHDRRARQRKTLLRPDHMADALARIPFVVIFDTEKPGVLGEIRDLRRALGIGVRLAAIRRWHIMIDHHQRTFG